MSFSPPLLFNLSERLVAIRRETFGEGPSGLAALALALQLPTRTWVNYEAGVMMPATVMIHFLVLTGANPTWLKDGSGQRYLPAEKGGWIDSARLGDSG